jgi:uncharacterized protein
VIRSARVSDAARLAELWRAAGLRFHPELTERELTSALRPDLVLVEEDAADEITGTVFGTFDGVRGWVRHLATRPDRRGRGIATALLAELERRLIAARCPKVNLLIEPDNAAVAGFYARLGYHRDELVFMEKWLTPDDPPQASEPAPGILRDIRPDLSADPYVFARCDKAEPPPDLAPFAVIREDEGLTLILARADADRGGLAYGYVAARITLRVNSALADVGLTAMFSRVLADAGISCNVIAGLAHDHLFVEWDHRARALGLLQNL